MGANVGGCAAGAEAVEVVHVFLEEPQRPASASYTSADLPVLRTALADLVRGGAPALDLPGGIRARCHERVVQLEQTSINKESRKAGETIPDS